MLPDVAYFTKTPNGPHQVLYSTQIDLDLDSQYYFRPGSWPWLVHGAAGCRGAQMINMAHLMTMMVEFTSETRYKPINHAFGGREVLCRSEIRAGLK